jgi:phosphate transport system permease protein
LLSISKTGFADKFFQKLTAFFALLILLLAAGTAVTLLYASLPTLQKFGWGFLSGTDWNPVEGHEAFGALPYIYGTLVSSFLALFIAAPFGLGIALFLTELAPMWLRDPIAFLVEILAAIPSVVYGLWGMFLLAPFMREHVDPLLIGLGTPVFKGPHMGLSMMTAGVILAVMILPTITAISREVFEAVPNSYRESAKALGATSWETIQLAVFKPARVGVLGAIMLALGRALGETMAVTMVIGNTPQISTNLLATGHSMASVIACEYAEANGGLHISALAEIGLLLMVITLVLNIGAHLLVWATATKFQK